MLGFMIASVSSSEACLRTMFKFHVFPPLLLSKSLLVIYFSRVVSGKRAADQDSERKPGKRLIISEQKNSQDILLGVLASCLIHIIFTIQKT